MILYKVYETFKRQVSYKRYFRCNNCFLLLVYTIHLSLSTDLVDPSPMGTFGLFVIVCVWQTVQGPRGGGDRHNRRVLPGTPWFHDSLPLFRVHDVLYAHKGRELWNRLLYVCCCMCIYFNSHEKITFSWNQLYEITLYFEISSLEIFL